jgi:hypothetical protein
MPLPTITDVTVPQVLTILPHLNEQRARGRMYRLSNRAFFWPHDSRRLRQVNEIPHPICSAA